MYYPAADANPTNADPPPAGSESTYLAAWHATYHRPPTSDRTATAPEAPQSSESQHLPHQARRLRPSRPHHRQPRLDAFRNQQPRHGLSLANRRAVSRSHRGGLPTSSHCTPSLSATPSISSALTSSFRSRCTAASSIWRLTASASSFFRTGMADEGWRKEFELSSAALLRVSLRKLRRCWYRVKPLGYLVTWGEDYDTCSVWTSVEVAGFWWRPYGSLENR